MNYTKNLKLLLLRHNSDIKVWQMPITLHLWSYQLENKPLSKQKFFRTNWPSHKLSDKHLGPFEILAKARSHSYTLRLLDTFCGVHPVFHFSMLEPATPNEIPNRVQSPPPPVKVQGDLEYEISEVVDSQDRPSSILQTLIPCTLARPREHRWRVFMAPRYGARKRQRTSNGLSLCISKQTWTSFKPMTFDPNP